MLRLLCLKPALQATVTSPEFKDLRAFEEIARVRRQVQKELTEEANKAGELLDPALQDMFRK